MARIKSTLISAYPAFSAQSTGGVSFPAYPTLNDAPAQQLPNAPLQLGDKIVDKYGNAFVYVRAAAALAAGQVLTFAANQTGTVSAGTTANLVKTNITTTLDEAMIGSFLTCNGATGGAAAVFTKLIKNQVINAGGAKIGANTNFYVAVNDIRFGRGGVDGDTLGFVPTTGDAVHIVRPYSVDVCGVTGCPVGVAMGTVTSGNRTLVQVSGLALCLSVGTGTALTDGVWAVAGAAGTVLGQSATPDTAQYQPVVGIAKHANATTSRLQPVLLISLDGRL